MQWLFEYRRGGQQLWHALCTLQPPAHQGAWLGWLLLAISVVETSYGSGSRSVQQALHTSASFTLSDLRDLVVVLATGNISRPAAAPAAAAIALLHALCVLPAQGETAKAGRLGFVAGLIPQEKLNGFERLLFRCASAVLRMHLPWWLCQMWCQEVE
mgnify:CR=1 FL=1